MSKIIYKFIHLSFNNRIYLENKPCILICPLDWGLGHATRCVPIIRVLEELGYEVLIAADRSPLKYLENIFPHLEFIRLPGYHIQYPTNGNMAIKMLFSTPNFFWSIIKEHFKLKKLISEARINGIISDNRYGLWNQNIPTVFITHQVFIKSTPGLKILEPLINRINHFFIRKYDSCWIPDFQGKQNLSGALSHAENMTNFFKYIGPLSRFNEFESESKTKIQKRYDIAFILSGPEPQRTILEQKIFKQLSGKEIEVVVVRGVINHSENYISDYKTSIYSYIDFIKLKEIIVSSRIIVCRPGYSSIMDLEAIGRKAVLIPTPGQTEQEYLAKHLVQTRGFTAVSQDSFDLDSILSNHIEVESERIISDSGILRNEITNTFGHLLKSG